ncbi:hypothetical protein [Pseudonocardia hydrocarbonoxydans]|nr:hypothetical protein [Pseudonocardia hydrocarbonoxydans]
MSAPERPVRFSWYAVDLPPAGPDYLLGDFVEHHGFAPFRVWRRCA